MAGTPQTICIEPADQKPTIREALAVEAFTPGHLLERVAGGYQLHSTAVGNAQALFADVNIADAGDIDREYAIGETARGYYAKQGDLAYALVAAGADAIVAGAPLASDGAGGLEVLTTPATDHVVAWASEAVDNSGGGTAVRIKVEVA